jgi:copper chaperone CopZ
MTKKVFKIKDMHCTSCAMAIEMDLEDAGIKAKGNYPKAVVEVEYDEKKYQNKDIIALIKKSGYTVE